jgi:hypothetical protein
MTYKFDGIMLCEKCKFRCAGVDANSNTCPYLAGWQDGQGKLQRWLTEPCEDHPVLRGFGTALTRRDCTACQKEIGRTAPVSTKGGL